jgi:hypothetical protein
MYNAHCKPNPKMTVGHDQLILVNKAVNAKLEKELEEEKRKKQKNSLMTLKVGTALHTYIGRSINMFTQLKLKHKT